MIDWPANLVRSIARRRAVILIGSGVSANSQAPDGSRPPTWGQFLNDAYADLSRRVPHIAAALKRFNYLDACDYIKSEHGAEWGEIIRRKFVTPHYKAAAIHEAIFNLDSRIVVSLNFDKIYENYAISRSEGTFIIKNYYDDDIRQVVAGEDRYILKPHGTVDSISKMVFTTSDYGKVRNKYRSFYELMTSLLHTHTFLCVGCGLSDPDMQIIFENYRYSTLEIPHYMTLPTPISTGQIELIKIQEA